MQLCKTGPQNISKSLAFRRGSPDRPLLHGSAEPRPVADFSLAGAESAVLHSLCLKASSTASGIFGSL